MINNIRKLLLSLAAALAIAGPAGATTYYNVPTDGTPRASLVAPSFMDVFNFTLDSAVASHFNVTAIGNSVSMVLDFPDPWPDVEIKPVTFTKIELFNGTSALPGSSLGYITPNASSFSFSGVLDAGNYFAKVWGNVSTPFGGAYVVALQAAPVPEPGEWAMILAGLGIVGFMARRRAGAR